MNSHKWFKPKKENMVIFGVDSSWKIDSGSQRVCRARTSHKNLFMIIVIRAHRFFVSSSILVLCHAYFVWIPQRKSNWSSSYTHSVCPSQSQCIRNGNKRDIYFCVCNQNCISLSARARSADISNGCEAMRGNIVGEIYFEKKKKHTQIYETYTDNVFVRTGKLDNEFNYDCL